VSPREGEAIREASVNQSEWWFRISVDAQSAATLRYSSAKSRQRSARYSGSDMIPPKDKTVPDSAEVGARSRWSGRNEESLSDKFLFLALLSNVCE